MTGETFIPKPYGKGDYVVRAPRDTDAVGHALRGAFGEATTGDFAALLYRLDRIAVN